MDSRKVDPKIRARARVRKELRRLARKVNGKYFPAEEEGGNAAPYVEVTLLKMKVFVHFMRNKNRLIVRTTTRINRSFNTMKDVAKFIDTLQLSEMGH